MRILPSLLSVAAFRLATLSPRYLNSGSGSGSVSPSLHISSEIDLLAKVGGRLDTRRLPDSEGSTANMWICEFGLAFHKRVSQPITEKAMVVMLDPEVWKYPDDWIRPVKDATQQMVGSSPLQTEMFPYAKL